MKNKYERIKVLINKLYLTTVKSKDLIIDGITYDNVRDTIRILNKFNLLSLNTTKGYNNLKENLRRSDYFPVSEYNVSLISSLLYSKENNTEKILEYIFNDTPHRISSSIINKYSKSIDSKFFKLIDNYKYQVFNTIINEYKDSTKVICEVYNSEKYINEEVVLLQIYVFEDSWYVCAFDIKENELKLINSEFIDSIKIKENFFNKFISSKEIDDFVDSYFQKKNEEEVVYLTLNAETLSLLDKFNLIKDFEIFENKIDFENSRLNFVDTQSNIIKQKKTDQIYVSLEHIKNKIEFEYFSPRKYIVKTKLSKNKRNIIKNMFPNIKIKMEIKSNE